MKKKQVITDDFVITSEIARAINYWLHDLGDDTSKFHTRMDLEAEIRMIALKALEEGRKKVEKYKDRLNGNTPKWIVKVLFNEGYGKQCAELGPFEADTREEAQRLGEERVTELFSEKPNADIIDIKVKKYKDGHLGLPPASNP